MKITSSRKSYSDVSKIKSYDDRFNYLKDIVHNSIGDETFGSHRDLYERFLKSKEWRDFRRKVIIRDKGCDLGIDGYELSSKGTVHHINPITYDDFMNYRNERVLNLENAILVDPNVHKLIHFGSEGSRPDKKVIVRRKNDTCPWKEEK